MIEHYPKRIERYISKKHSANLFFMAGFRTETRAEGINSSNNLSYQWSKDQQEMWKKGCSYARVVCKKHPNQRIEECSCGKEFSNTMGHTKHCGCNYNYGLLNATSDDKGWRAQRTKYPSSIREYFLASDWIKENQKRVGINFGHGILQDLFCERVGILEREKAEIVINKRDRFIAATVIQWLGSNCGFAFIKEAFKKSGYEISKIK